MPRVFNCICIAAAVERSGTCITHEKLSLSLPSVARVISTTRAVWDTGARMRKGWALKLSQVFRLRSLGFCHDEPERLDQRASGIAVLCRDFDAA